MARKFVVPKNLLSLYFGRGLLKYINFCISGSYSGFLHNAGQAQQDPAQAELEVAEAANA